MSSEKSYRKLTAEEINALAKNGCSSDNWSRVKVITKPDTTAYLNVHFTGDVKLGAASNKERRRETGIYNAHIDNCTIGNNCLISNITGKLSNYNTGEKVTISGCGTIATHGTSSFGNGTPVKVINEAGGREVLIFDNLTAQIAWVMAMHRHRPAMIKALTNLIENYCSEISSDRGTIGDNALITGCSTILNVNIGSSAVIENALRLSEGTINSSSKAPARIGDGVIMEQFIVANDAEITGGAMLKRCFAGNGSRIGKQFTAVDSLFFANTMAFNGEAVSLFAGPYTVTHHKSTLLIAASCSFMNAGSGTNQSNHNYKLGPIHQGILERGTKTASGSYALWPAHIGPFSLLAGRLYLNADTSELPFSYIIGSEGNNTLVPAINLRGVGTVRDAIKWKKRDLRSATSRKDIINATLFNPFIAGKLKKGIAKLKSIALEEPDSKGNYRLDGMTITPKAVERGIELYSMAFMKYLGNIVVKRIAANRPSRLQQMHELMKPISAKGVGEWNDLAGMIAPKDEINLLLNDIENGVVKSPEEITSRLKKIEAEYETSEWNFVSLQMETIAGRRLDEMIPADLADLTENWKKSVTDIDYLLYEDAMKEFTDRIETGFGIDGDEETRKRDFQEVRGNPETNESVATILSHIREKSELAAEVTAILKRIR